MNIDKEMQMCKYISLSSVFAYMLRSRPGTRAEISKEKNGKMAEKEIKSALLSPPLSGQYGSILEE